MSRAFICDKCGLVVDYQMGSALRAIWIKNPFLYEVGRENDYAAAHLCERCYKEFEDEYLANLKETYGQAMG